MEWAEVRIGLVWNRSVLHIKVLVDVVDVKVKGA